MNMANLRRSIAVGAALLLGAFRLPLAPRMPSASGWTGPFPGIICRSIGRRRKATMRRRTSTWISRKARVPARRSP